MLSSNGIPESVLANWQVERMLANSGQSTTYKIKNKNSGELGVLKIPNERLNGRKRIEEESRILQMLKHSRLPGVLGSSPEDSDECYLITQFIDGPTLADAVGKAGVSLDNALETCLKICRTLIYLREHQIIHRDIKPQNILLKGSDFSKPVLIDFGIAYRTARGELTGFAERLGNKFLELPEATEGPIDKRDHRSDITYLAGILLFMLTAKPPRKLLETWHGSMPHERRVAREKLSQYTPGQREGLNAFFNRAFQFTRRKRIQDARSAYQILQNIKEGGLRHQVRTFFAGNEYDRFVEPLAQDSQHKSASFYRDKIAECLDEWAGIEGLRGKSFPEIMRSVADYNSEDRASKERILRLYELLMECPDERRDDWSYFVDIAGPMLISLITEATEWRAGDLAEMYHDMMRENED